MDKNKIWTTVGSAGTIDETDVNKVFFDGSVVQMGALPIVDPGLQEPTNDVLAAQTSGAILPHTESAVIRYNIVPVDGLLLAPFPPCNFADCPGIALELRYLDSGHNAQVIAKLIEVDMATGSATVRLTFNSNSFDPVGNYQVQAEVECDPRWHFDFENKAYYIEATLTHSSLLAFSAAGIQIIRIRQIMCIG